ncbi:hypothetical protein SteCoe_35013 [Stentor coeruleus]|uniref:Uncharacterized protein n=1 Tax=Stentor coeruleus TaxID=5963 RepID=A0A1R2AT98_9CILI|nr:hypothetical protein SteCoe_35013 [Stentor coeruleus]
MLKKHDPFSNMIMRPNKSPVLKPVVVQNRDILQISRSAGSIRDRIKLPPIVTPLTTRAADRNSLKTPCFRIKSKKSRTHNDKDIKIKKNIDELDMSFGDVDEQIGGLNDIMKKYRT